jgi:hypothetical protein
MVQLVLRGLSGSITDGIDWRGMVKEYDINVYVNENQDYIWIERYAAPWPWIRRKALHIASNYFCGYGKCGIVYEGIRSGIKVNDNNADVCIEECECCRRIEAHQFLMAECG